MTQSAPLFDAIASGDLTAARSLLQDEPELARARNEDGVSAVLFACYDNRPEILDALLGVGPELDIHEASAVGRTGRVEELLGARPELAGSYSADGWTPLHLASFFGAPDAARALLQAGADVHAVSRNTMNNQPLHAAAAGAHGEICRLLVEHGADVNAEQQEGWTPLHSAAQRGDRELVELLLKAGADPARSNARGETPGDTAEKAGHAELARALRARVDDG